jgi:hypothetical protein
VDLEEKVVIGIAGGGLAAGAGYVLWRYLHPSAAQGKTPNAPTGLVLTPQAALSADNAPILAKVDPYLGPGVPTYNWYHFYLRNGVLYPKLVGSTSLPEFLFGRPGPSGTPYPVAPGRLYTVGAQVCVGNVCSLITQGHAEAMAYAANTGSGRVS